MSLKGVTLHHLCHLLLVEANPNFLPYSARKGGIYIECDSLGVTTPTPQRPVICRVMDKLMYFPSMYTICIFTRTLRK